MNETCVDVHCDEILALSLIVIVAVECLVSWLLLCCCFFAYDMQRLWLFEPK